MRTVARNYCRQLFAISALALAACGGSGGDDAVSPTPVDPLTVVTTEGTLKGIQKNNELISYLGIPFAAPPVDSLRWKAPTPPAKYTGTYDASFGRSDCVQGSATQPSGSEDCLYLNIHRPTPGAVPLSNAPVMVWVHGGAYITGSGLLYNTEQLAKSQNIVVVSLNYRLGTLGFMAHPALSEEETPRRSGNYGILDIQAALKWVQNNIEKFGGNPNNVTAFGISAGGNAMNVLLASPQSAGLFDKVVASSGGYYRSQPALATAEALGEAAATDFGCSNESSSPDSKKILASCLRALPISKVLGKTFMEPIVDGKVLAETTPEAFKNGRFHKVPVISGSTLDEFAYAIGRFTPPATLENYTKLSNFNTPPEMVAEVYSLDRYNTPQQAAGAASVDYFWVCGAFQDLDSITSFVPNGYIYEFAEGNPTHGSDLNYWLGNLPEGSTPNALAISKDMQNRLGAFAKNSDPNYVGALPWPKYEAGTRKTMQFASPTNTTTDVFQNHNCPFWYTRPPNQGFF